MRAPPLIAGNWKKFGRLADLAELDRLAAAFGAKAAVQIVLCLPATLLAMGAARARGAIALGAQDCDARSDGAHTGDISAAMMADAGAEFVILGHSERRRDHGETNETVAAKAKAALAAGLTPIICVGETLEDRQAGRAEAVVVGQAIASLPLEGAGQCVLAYEPVWAIGTGLTPSASDIEAMHHAVKSALAARFAGAWDGRVLYGGSVNPKNAEEIFRVAGVDGALVGAASLKSAEFGAIIRSHPLYEAN